MKRLFAVICLFIWMPIPAMGGWFGPSNYEECILKHMKGVTSDKAVLEIRKACRAKFPEKPIKKPKLRDVPKEVLEDITGEAWFKNKAHPDAKKDDPPVLRKTSDIPEEDFAKPHDDWVSIFATPDAPRIYNFYAKLHNDNAKWTIAEVEIRIFDKETKTYEYILSHEPASGGIRRITGVTQEEWEGLPPFKSKRFPFFVKKVPAKWEWDIVGAKGYRKPFFSFFK